MKTIISQIPALKVTTWDYEDSEELLLLESLFSDLLAFSFLLLLSSLELLLG